MPKALEKKLKSEYPGNDHAVYGTLNSLGLMHGNKETPKGRAMDAKPEAKSSSKATGSHPHGNLGKYLHAPKRR